MPETDITSSGEIHIYYNNTLLRPRFPRATDNQNSNRWAFLFKWFVFIWKSVLRQRKPEVTKMDINLLIT